MKLPHQEPAGRRLTSVTVLAAVLLLAGCGSTKTVIQHDPGPTVTVNETETETVTATPQATPGQVILKHSGTGSWNSPPFEVGGGSPQLEVTYSYHGNGASCCGADNFSADIKSADDDQTVANDFESWSGSKTNEVYPDTSSGDTTYHLEVTASGSWSFTITEVS